MARAGAWAVAVAALAASSSAAAQTRWEAVRQGGQQPAARVQLAGPALRGIAVTCDKGRPLMAVRLATPPAARAAKGRLMVGGAIHEIGLARVGASETWAIPVTDPELLKRLAAGSGIATLHVAGAAAMAFPLAGADTAFAAALTGCYRPSAAAPPRTFAATGSLATDGVAADGVAIDKVVRRAYAYDEAAPPVRTRRARAIAAECEALQPRYDKKLGEAASFGLCHEDAGALCECQDLDDAVVQRTLRVTVAPTAPGRARATARFALFAGEPPTNAVTLEMVKTGVGWQVDRVGNEQQMQLDGIATMRKALGLPAWSPPVGE